jgi:hypothetical protein
VIRAEGKPKINFISPSALGHSVDEYDPPIGSTVWGWYGTNKGVGKTAFVVGEMTYLGRLLTAPSLIHSPTERFAGVGLPIRSFRDKKYGEIILGCAIYWTSDKEFYLKQIKHYEDDDFTILHKDRHTSMKTLGML